MVQQRWLTKSMGYDFTIEYKQGLENMVADALSRREGNAEIAAISQPLPSWLEPIEEDVHAHSQLQCLVQLCLEGEAVGPWAYKEGALFFKGRIYLREDSPLIFQIIREIHSSMRATIRHYIESVQIFIGRGCALASKILLSNVTSANVINLKTQLQQDCSSHYQYLRTFPWTS